MKPMKPACSMPPNSLLPERDQHNAPGERLPRSRRGAVNGRVVVLNRQRAAPAPAGAQPLPVGGQGLTGHAEACRSGHVSSGNRGRPDGARHGDDIAPFHWTGVISNILVSAPGTT